MSADADPIRIVAAVVADDDGNVLLVRKRGSTVFIQPGGKREPGEHATATLARELREELGVELDLLSVRSLGTFEEAAVHEAGRRVRADAYVVRVVGAPEPRSEIEEMCWIAPQAPHAVTVAPLSARHILPAWRAFAADPDGRLRRAPAVTVSPAPLGPLALTASQPASLPASLSPLPSSASLPPLTPLPPLSMR